MTPRVVIDACLLVKGNVSNVLFDLAQHGLIALHWTPQIAAEFVKNWSKRRVKEENAQRRHEGKPPLGKPQAAQIRAGRRTGCASSN